MFTTAVTAKRWAASGDCADNPSHECNKSEKLRDEASRPGLTVNDPVALVRCVSWEEKSVPQRAEVKGTEKKQQTGFGEGGGGVWVLCLFVGV